MSVTVCSVVRPSNDRDRPIRIVPHSNCTNCGAPRIRSRCEYCGTVTLIRYQNQETEEYHGSAVDHYCP